ncbi:hypothetical protein CBR_g19454 [Chara braunii]|uniref:Uncharacterized protein n=1 Tax=Chara braunii TaxID=69332 RepID=A0A388KXZ1_CHABU|nr:hypothetical protein CBR_g19454 [Chara braunii]|eukprot:GBG74940.1 hypothetical protein CBR_g19454 [Chara braunii]
MADATHASLVLAGGEAFSIRSALEEDTCEDPHEDALACATIPASGAEEGVFVMAPIAPTDGGMKSITCSRGFEVPAPIQGDGSTAAHRPLHGPTLRSNVGHHLSVHQRRRRPHDSERRGTSYVKYHRGSLMLGAMTDDELGACLAKNLTEARREARIDSKKAKGVLPRVQSVSWGPASPTPPSDGSVALGAMGVSVAQSPPSVARDRRTRSPAPTSAAGRQRERGDATTRDVGASLLGRTDVPWSYTRKSTTASRKKQPRLGR